jgi:predicted transcriptional regulator
MLINKIKPATKTILNILQEKHNIFDLQQKVNINLSATRQVVVRLMDYKLVYACDTKLDDIRQRRLTYYQITEAGTELLNKINKLYGVEETKTNSKKNYLFGHTMSLNKTREFIETLKHKATPWDALLLKDKNA